MNYCYPDNTRLAILNGETLDGDRLYYKSKIYFKISCFLTETQLFQNNHLGGSPRIKLDDYLQNRNIFNSEKIIITYRRSTENIRYIVSKLKKNGLKLYDDFILSDWFINPSLLNYIQLDEVCDSFEEKKDFIRKIANGRKIVTIIGNCQITYIEQCLLSNKEFQDKHLLISVPRICNVTSNDEKKLGNDDFWRLFDIIITQPINEKNRHTPIYATNLIKNKCINNCKIVVISNCTFMGYFPQYLGGDFSNLENIGNQMIIKYPDKNLNDMMDIGLSYKEIIEKVSSVNFYSVEYISTFMENQLRISKEREQDVDVKIFDYVSEHYKNRILFHSYNHPANEVVKELSVRIMEFIGIKNTAYDKEEFLDSSQYFKMHIQSIYPSILNSLENKESSLYRYYHHNNAVIGEPLIFKEHIELYLAAYKRIKKPIIINIWGTCVSREIFNYTNDFTVNNYILQNSIQTLTSNPIEIEERDIVATSNYTKRMLELEFAKDAISHFKKAFSDWLIIDMADCRNDWYEINSDNSEISIKITESLSSSQTLLHLKNIGKIDFERKSVFTITDQEWKNYVLNFCNIIKEKYEEDRIILHKVRFAKHYISSDGIFEFDNLELYNKLNEIMIKVEDMVLKALPKCKVLEQLPLYLADDNHRLGRYSLHYVKEIYEVQAAKLFNIIFGLDNKFLNEIYIEQIMKHDVNGILFEEFSNN